MTFLGIALVVLDILLGVNTIAGYIAIVPIIGLPQFFNKVCKITEEYNLEYEKWLVFKDYLISHPQLIIPEMPASGNEASNSYLSSLNCLSS